jgi:N-acetylglucosaminyldiphosphoundecaprenol N-acetyl-beta-D-mannosaminyltransferase
MAVEALGVMEPPLPVRRFLGVELDAATMQQAVEICRRAIEGHRQLLIGVVNAAKIVNMHREAGLHDAVSATDLTLADGMAVVWASRLLGQPLPERVAGIDLFLELLSLADRHHYSVYLLGAEQSVLDSVEAAVRRDFPGARIVGSHHGYFSSAEEEGIAEEIRQCRPDLLFVAITSPKKEVFLSRWGARMQIAVCHGVGGSFDVVAGKVRRAPRIWQRLGLEWLYRVLQEPRRLWRRYLVTNVLFTGMVLRELAGRLRPGRVTTSARAAEPRDP